jgi:adenylyltransferase/sulfurtransferase
MPDNAESLFRDYDLVLDCTDNLETKFLISDAAVLTCKPVVFASVYQFEGQISVYDPGADSPCLRCLWTTPPEPGCVGSCAEVGVLGAVPGVLGSMQAMEAIKLLLGLPGVLKEETMFFDLLSMITFKAKNRRNPDCPACGCNPSIKGLAAGSKDKADSLEVKVGALTPEFLVSHTVIDVREVNEVAAESLNGLDTLHIPCSRFEEAIPTLVTDARYVLCCAGGVRSLALTKRLRAQGFDHVYSLKGGAKALRRA